MCSREDSTRLCLRLVEGQRAPRSQGSPGGTWDLGPGTGVFLFVLLSHRYLVCMTKVLEGKGY